MKHYPRSESCNYKEFMSEITCDKIVVRILDRALYQQLHLDAELTLEIANKRIQQREAVGERQKLLNGGKEESVNLHELPKCNQWQRRGISNRTSNAIVHNRRVTTVQLRMSTRPRQKIPFTKETHNRCGRDSHP